MPFSCIINFGVQRSIVPINLAHNRLINCVNELSKTKSQDVEDSVSHCTSGRLKSSTKMVSADGVASIICVRFEITSIMLESLGLGGR